MRMPNVKRFVIIVCSLLCLLVVAITSTFYFLNVNDYSKWISEQIKQSTGYDVRFENFENNWLVDNHLSLVGVSLYQQQQQILYIQKLELQIKKLDLWQRDLEIESIHIQGVEIDISQPLMLKESQLADIKDNIGIEGSSALISNPQILIWEKLHIANLQITDLNASMQHKGQNISLTGASVELNDLLIMDHKQLQTLPKRLDITTQFTHLQFSDKSQAIQINNAKLSVNGDLLKRQANIDLSADVIELKVVDQIPLLFESLQVQLQLVQNKLSLVSLSVNAFAGSLIANADALLAINFLPKPAIKFGPVVLNALIAKDMQIVIPSFSSSNTQPKKSTTDELFPIREFLIKNINLQNISLHSELETLPLTVKSADLQVSDFYLVKDNKLFDMTLHSKQTGDFSFAFDHMRWDESVIEQFSVIGSLGEDDPGIRLLKKLLIKK
jgi:hypothetical protein